MAALCSASIAALACSESDAPRPGEAATPRPPPLPDERVEQQPAPTREDVAEGYASEAAREPEVVDWSGGDAAAGAAVYQSHCALCHGPSGRGDGPAAVALNPKPRDFSDGTFYLDANANGETGEDVDLARVILEGAAAFGGSNGMQPWDEALPDEEVRNVVAHLRTLKGGG
jgi:mono/diheme cytochrome c family protein